MRKLLLSLFLFSLLACKQEQTTLFRKMSERHTGISFSNDLALDENFDVFRYRNYYNGGGVAIGDINNDGLPDIYFTANNGPNSLYLNKGNFKFEDITEKAGVSGAKEWTTGVSMADVNGDGLLDIYVCNSGDILGGQRQNELFINNGDLTFSESGAEYGLDDTGFSTHAVFFDYDQDEDLDCYVLNNSFRPVSSLSLENIRHVRDSTGGDKLYRNDNGKFTDVSEQAGIYGSVIGFGLAVTLTDVNQDHWLDIYISNDFFERDYLYLNNQDGTFREALPEKMGHISQFSMGTDAADVNNDGYPEIFTTDMLPEKDYRLKTTTQFESYHLHQNKLANDYYEQYMRNSLQLNNGDGSFTEIGQYAGVDASDWSWGTLIADFDNDAYKEIFVTNGIYRDVTNQDFLAYLTNNASLLTMMRKQKVNFKELVEKMPSNKLSNYLFKQTSDLRFSNISEEWGLDEPSFSNGTAYGDLDNDGDLDLVVNNVNQQAFIYRNESDKLSKKNHLKISFQGPGKNKYGIGARVNAYVGNTVIMQENITAKGFQSSNDYTMVMGLDTMVQIDSLVVYWGYNKKQTLINIKANQHIDLNINDALTISGGGETLPSPIFSEKKGLLNPVYKHKEDRFVDFDREQMIYHMLSREGPALAIDDINGDGLDDFYIGGATGSSGVLYVQDKNGNFASISQEDFEKDKNAEDTDALFFDADGDGDLDLYVVSGGYAFRQLSREYQDRLYLLSGIESGKPVYRRSQEALPLIFEVGSCVRAADYDNDGDIDLFTGGRAVAGQYGFSTNSRLLENDGSGRFTDATGKVAPGLFELGKVTCAQWVDYDNDEDLDLVVVGEWMPIILFKNNGVNLERLNNVPGLVKSEGWWNRIYTSDINNDGNMDFIVGNWGLNTKFKASPEKPVKLFMGDYNADKITDHIFTYYQNGSLYPMALRQSMVTQMTYLEQQFGDFEDYAGKTIEQVLTQEQLSDSYVNNAYRLESVVVINNGDGSYEIRDLPKEVQYSPVFAIEEGDFDRDNEPEFFIAGNFSGVKPEEGRYDANPGLIVSLGNQQYEVKSIMETGLNIRGDVRAAKVARTINNKSLLIVARNNDELGIYEF